MHRLLAPAIVFLAAALARADITLPSIIGDNMVLQRDSKACIWGWATPGGEVEVSAPFTPDGRGDVLMVRARADDHGRWRASVPTPHAGGPYAVVVRSEREEITLHNVMVGEVWLCSGQSNMEWPLSASGDDPEAEVAAADHPGIRLFTAPNTISVHERIDVDGGAWAECSPATAKQFSAVGYYFGRDLNDNLNVPIGLIDATWGGTVAQAWMSAAALDGTFPEFEADLKLLASLRLDPAERAAADAGDWWSLLDGAGGIGHGWAAAEFDDSGWSTTQLPATWAADLASFDGVVYFRRTVDVPADLATGECVLELGPIDDYDDAYVNGQSVGATHGENQWSVARRYIIPAGLLNPGANLIAVRVLDSAGPGGINGPADSFVLRGNDARVSLAGEWRYTKGAPMSALPSRDHDNRLGPNTPTLLYNGMIAPLTPYTLRGAIWYQGESNRDNPSQYGALLGGLINSWRDTWRAAGNAEWKDADYPFYLVQIAPYRHGGDSGQTALLRETQAQVAASQAKCGMVTTLDLGDRTDIHPRNKAEVGRRLALLALARTYGVKGVVDSGPEYESVEVRGDAARVKFKSVAGGLEARGALTGFTIAGTDKQFHTARAEIVGDDAVRVSSPRVKRPIAVRYAWSQTPTASLFNKAGLPAGPFRTDDWTGAPLAVEDDGQTEYLSDDPKLRPLFNGKDLSGWVNVNCAPATWSVKDGRIFCTGTPTGVLRTEKMYQNFVLELEWRHLSPGGNAGLFVWSDALTARGQPFTRSVEVQVMDGAEGDGYTSDGDIFPIHGAAMTPENGRPGSSRAFPTERRANFSPEWNHYRVECVDGAISLAVNGKVVTRGRDVTPRRGYICLESEGSPVEFRNIRLKPLPSSGYLAPEQVAAADDGFAALYNGADLAGWKAEGDAASHWRAADWTLNFDGAGADLWSEKSYKDFVLIADWRWSAPPHDAEVPVVLADGTEKTGDGGKPEMVTVKEAGDSGIYLRGSSKAQVNMWCWPVGSGEVYGYRTDAAQAADVRAGATPSTAADAPLGQWNRFVITMRGERLTVELNGKRVIDKARLPGVAREGPIALQAHGTPVQFANIFIKELR